MIDNLVPRPTLPLQIVHAQAMNQQQHFAGGLRHGERVLDVERLTPIAQRHRRGQGVLTLQQTVPHYSIERCQHGFALGCFGRLCLDSLQQWLQADKCRVEPLANPLGNTLNALVNQAGQAARCARRFAAGHTHAAPDRLMHALSNPRHTGSRLRCQLRNRAQIRRSQMLHAVAPA